MLTPFCGSGSECVAAKIAGRDYIGFEIEDEYVELAEKRLENAERGSKLPPKEDSSRINPTLFQERK